MSRLFANGTEGGAWEAVWCSVCANDDGCKIALAMILEPDQTPPEIIEQPEGEYWLPPAHLCTAYTPPATGDPRASERADVVAYVTAKRRPVSPVEAKP